MIQISYSMFFDRKIVGDSLSAAGKRNLSKFGSFVRRTAKGLIRKRKGISKPNNPPSSHTGKLRDLIYFGYDSSSKSVVIGPQLFSAARGGGKSPSILEFGGTESRGRGRPAHYSPRPFMGPAFNKELPKFAQLFADCIKG